MSAGRHADVVPQKALKGSGRPPGQPRSTEGRQGPSGQARGHHGAGSQVVRVIPALFPEAWRRRLMQPLRVWYLLRTLDQEGNGRWSKAKALALSQRLGWSLASAYRLISKGMGTFWREETTYPHGTHGLGRKTLVLVGAKAVAASWGLNQLSRYQVEVPWELCASDVASWNSLAYHACLPGPRPPRIAKNGQERKPFPNHPYSRAKIRKDTGISERTQMRRQGLLMPSTWRKVTPKQANYRTYRGELKSKRHHSWALKRLGNTYTSNLARRGWGQGRAFNKERGEFRPHARDATGSSSTDRTRRFFEKPGDLLRARRKGRPLYPDAMVRISPASGDVPSAVRSRPYLGWWEVPQWAAL